MTTSRSRWQFSLSSLFVLSTVVAVAIVLWQWCPVTGVSLSGADVVFQMSDEFAQQMWPGDPYSYPNADSSHAIVGNTDVYVHDFYIAIPTYVVVAGLLIVVGCVVIAWLAIRRWRR